MKFHDNQRYCFL